MRMNDEQFRRLCEANNRLVDVIDLLGLAGQEVLRRRAVNLKLQIIKVWERECKRRKKQRSMA